MTINIVLYTAGVLGGYSKQDGNSRSENKYWQFIHESLHVLHMYVYVCMYELKSSGASHESHGSSMKLPGDSLTDH